jgi:hypothetical protein
MSGNKCFFSGLTFHIHFWLSLVVKNGVPRSKMIMVEKYKTKTLYRAESLLVQPFVCCESHLQWTGGYCCLTHPSAVPPWHPLGCKWGWHQLTLRTVILVVMDTTTDWRLIRNCFTVVGRVNLELFRSSLPPCRVLSNLSSVACDLRWSTQFPSVQALSLENHDFMHWWCESRD